MQSHSLLAAFTSLMQNSGSQMFRKVSALRSKKDDNQAVSITALQGPGAQRA